MTFTTGLPAGSKDDNKRVSLWERDGTVWVRASTSDVGLPMEPAPITDVWDDTGILPSVQPLPAYLSLRQCSPYGRAN